jgi:RimJ/RimL family protein N-acetyltransferase
MSMAPCWRSGRLRRSSASIADWIAFSMSETTIAAAPPRVLETERLVLRELQRRDASFILALVNEPSWLRFIGDKGVRTLEDAVNYIAEGPARMYARHGFGLWLVELREGSAPVGLCGPVKR